MRFRPLFAITLAGLCLTAGCSVDVKDGLGPRVPLPNVTGTVLRDGQMTNGVKAEIRAVGTAETLDTSYTDRGAFEFFAVPAGHWEVKISGGQTGDFDSVSREFTLANPDSLHELNDFDIWAYGAEPLAPEADAVRPVPNIFTPLDFIWSLPAGSERDLDWIQVRLYTEAGEIVWSSEKNTESEVGWNGIGNEGVHAGQSTDPGNYYWRMKLAFTDSLEARLDPRNLVLE